MFQACQSPTLKSWLSTSRAVSCNQVQSQRIDAWSLQLMIYFSPHPRYGPDTGGTDSDNDSMASSVEFELGLGKKKATFGKLLGKLLEFRSGFCIHLPTFD